MSETTAAGAGGELRDELRPARLASSVTTGLIFGVMAVVLATSFAALVFTGPLAGRLFDGIGLTLLTAVVVIASIALLSSLPGMIGSAQDVTAAILAISALGIAGRIGDDETAFLTVVAAITVTTAATGLVFLLLGGWGLGNLVRFVPYPVIGGFLAGTGWLLAKGGIGVASGVGVSLGTVDDLVRPGALARWLPALGVAVVLLYLTRRVTHGLTLPAVIAASVVAFYAVMLATGGSLAEAERGGWLLGPFPSGGLFRLWTVEAVTGAAWGEVAREVPNLLTVPLLAVVSLLLNTSGVELATRTDVDLNRELRAAGIANLVASAGGGLVGFHTLSLSTLAHRARANTRATGFVAASVCLVALLFGGSFLSLVPRLVLAGLILYLGLSFLLEWVIAARRSLSRAEHLLVLVILVTIAAIGFLPGVGIGLVIALVMFVVQYSRTDIVKHTLSGDAFHSRVDRDPTDREVLRREGQGIRILELQGFVFFGTANSLLARIREWARGDEPARFLVVDFRRVSGIDSSAVMSFVRAQQLAESEGFTLVLSGIRPGVRIQLERGGFVDEHVADGGMPHVRELPDLDLALQWCEDALLGRRDEEPERQAVLRRMLGNEVDLVRLARYLDIVDAAAGEEVIRQGDTSDDLYLLTDGRLTARMTTDEGDSVRLRTMGPGSVVGEVAMYLGGARVASVVSEEPSRFYRLTPDALARMERADPDLAAALHRAFARLLAERLTDTLRTMDALLD